MALTITSGRCATPWDCRGLSLAVIGVYNEEELVQNIEWVRRYTPLDAGEQQVLLAQGRDMARQWGPHYGSVE